MPLCVPLKRDDIRPRISLLLNVLVDHGKWSHFPSHSWSQLRPITCVRPTSLGRRTHSTYSRSLLAPWRFPYLPVLFEVNLCDRISLINSRRSQNKSLHVRLRPKCRKHAAEAAASRTKLAPGRVTEAKVQPGNNLSSPWLGKVNARSAGGKRYKTDTTAQR